MQSVKIDNIFSENKLAKKIQLIPTLSRWEQNIWKKSSVTHLKLVRLRTLLLHHVDELVEVDCSISICVNLHH